MRSARKGAWAVSLLLMMALAGSLPLGAAAAERVPVTEAEGREIAAAALRFTEVQLPGGAAEPGMPYLWGGRTTVEELAQSAQGGDAPASVGVDASGLVVNALRTVFGPGIRFVGMVDGARAQLADATSHLLYGYNVQPVEPARARPGDLLFFGQDGNISGVAVVVENGGDRLDFVVASARAGRVIRTFARIGGDYWNSAIAGVGRFLKPAS